MVYGRACRRSPWAALAEPFDLAEVGFSLVNGRGDGEDGYIGGDARDGDARDEADCLGFWLGRGERSTSASTCCARSRSRPTPRRRPTVADTTAASELVVMEAMHYRCHPLVQRLRELVIGETFGPVRHIQRLDQLRHKGPARHQVRLRPRRRGTDGRRLLRDRLHAVAGRWRAFGRVRACRPVPW